MISVIILAAGQGSRMKLNYNKMFYEIEPNLTIIEKCLLPFSQHFLISEIIVVCNQEEEERIQNILADYKIKTTHGGHERYDSVINGLALVTNDYVLIHDGARCFISDALITKISQSTISYQAAILAVKAKDTIHIEKEGFLESTIERQHAYLAQTPQGFKTELIKEAYQIMKDNPKKYSTITDDAMLVNTVLNQPIKIVESDYSNLKVTTIEDVKHV
ncbi:2-C-methyl-D-erythritol 4-phosphate cytidylyltransferase [Erysipelotrichaceae bacterium OttesenSCG-928-M19]|nr:2-C-methyl-D-erythritol 4-phosphate cytidylyltransferase [Erysipelotrichaceae bacterium OttesenSCG-928-M19]